MKYIKLTNLTAEYINDLSTLNCTVNDAADVYILSYNEDKITGYICAYKADIYELTGFILPDFRRQHIFTKLFNQLKTDLELSSYTFSGSKSEAFSQCAKFLGASYTNTEYLMELKHSLPVNKCSLKYKYKNSTYYYYMGLYKIGHCSIFEEKSTINIYDVFVNPRSRNQGLGTLIFINTLYHLKDYKKRIILQVSDNNKPAFRIYSSCGFEIIDSVCYYSKLV